MTAGEFIQKWQNSRNYLGLPSVGIHVDWNLINLNSLVKTYSGQDGWNLLYTCTAPWFKKPQTFKELINTKNADCLQIIQEETDNHKIEYYQRNGLKEPFFCAFAKQDGSFILLGDGNHRFLDCIYLIDHQYHDFGDDIKKTSVDVIYLTNFVDVLRTDLIWK